MPDMQLTLFGEPSRLSAPPLGANLGKQFVVDGVSYVEVAAKSALNQLPHSTYGFHWTLNVYRGCRHACPFCFARGTHQYLGYDEPGDFDRTIFYKQNAPQLIEAELSSKRWQREHVAIGTATDDYQPIERKLRLTRSCMELLAAFNTPTSVVTKSDLVLRDADILLELKRRNGSGRVGMSMTSMDPALNSWLEPTVVTVQRRLDAIHELSRQGVHVNLMMTPILPGLTDDEGALEAMIVAAKQTGVRRIKSGVLFLSHKAVRRFWFEQLGDHRPDLMPLYMKLYENRATPPDSYTKPLLQRVAKLKRKHGFG